MIVKCCHSEVFQQANDAERVAEELRREAREERKAKEATKENEGKHRRKDH